MNELVQISAAEQALLAAQDPEDVLAIRSKMRAIELLLREIDEQSEIAQRATMIRIRAERKLGEWIRENIGPGNPQLTGDPLIGHMGVSRDQARRWRILAELEIEKFESFIDEHIARGWALSTAGIIRYAENSKAKKTGVFRSGNLAVDINHRVCWLRGYKARCAGPITGGHIIHKGEVIGNSEARRILAACPDEIMTPQCYEHNINRWANHREAKRILLTLKIYEIGLPRLEAWFDRLHETFKVPRPELELRRLLDV